MNISVFQFEGYGLEDINKSIVISPNGENLQELLEDDYNEILQSKIEKNTFCEKERGTIENGKTFYSLKMKNWYFLWIEELSRWIAIYFHTEMSSDGYGSPIKVDITITKGPYNIGQTGSLIIKKYFNSEIALDDIEQTSPLKFEELLGNRKDIISFEDARRIKQRKEELEKNKEKEIILGKTIDFKSQLLKRKHC